MILPHLDAYVRHSNIQGIFVVYTDVDFNQAVSCCILKSVLNQVVRDLANSGLVRYYEGGNIERQVKLLLD